MIRVVLPAHLRTLAGVGSEVYLEVEGPATIATVLDVLEDRYPMLRGTLRDHGTLKRRDLVRFFVCEEDWSNQPMTTSLPEAISAGREPLLIIGAIAGG